MARRPLTQLGEWLPWEGQFLAVFLPLLLVLGGLYAVITPPLQSPDEPQHLVNLILVGNAGRPVQEAERSPQLEASIGAWMERVHYWYYRFEPVPDPLPARLDAGVRPPLYYVLVGAVSAPFHPDSLLAWLAWGRAVSIVLAAATAGLIFWAVREIYPGDPFVPIVAAGFAGLLPLQVYLGASVSSDNLANFLAAGLFFLMARSLRQGISPGRAAGIGAILLGSYLTKLTTLFLIVPAAALGPLVVWARYAERGPRRARFSLPLALGAGGLAGLGAYLRWGAAIDWYLRHRVLYTPTMIEEATGRHLLDPEMLAQLATLAGTVYRQFWGSFGWLTIELDHGWYLAWGVALMLAIFGGLIALARTAWRGRFGMGKVVEADPGRARLRAAFLVGVLVWLLASAASLLALFAALADDGGALQGRYLLPDLGPLALLLALGWRSLLPAEWHRAGAVLLVGWFLFFNLAALTTAIIPAFYLTPNR